MNINLFKRLLVHAPPPDVCVRRARSQMTLTPCPDEYGRRCANGTKCKAKGGAEAQAHNWYFVDKKNKELGKVCTECYRAAAPPKSKAAGKRAREEEEEDATAGDTLLEIIRIYS